MTEKTLHNFDKNSFQNRLITWFDENKRDLPWRETSDPYKIWISEIMLQQTKVDTVIDYYNRFIHTYPTVFHLAKADEQALLKVWEGLGYYSRARNLHTAAKEVVDAYDGIMPKTAEELGKLKGIGPYTKGAISSIAYGHPEPAVDGNVMRVLSRVIAIKDNISEQRTRKRFEAIVREIISQENPSYFNQGLMELGALICTPTSPGCLHCPVRENCRAFELGIQTELPIKLKKKKQKKIAYYTFIIRDQSGNIAIEQRPNEGLLANMWQFPMIEKQTLTIDSMEKMIEKKLKMKVTVNRQLENITHIFSHIIWDLFVYDITVHTFLEPSTFQFVKKEALDSYPISVSHLKIKQYIL